MNTATTTKTPPAVAPTPPDEPGTRGTPLSLSPSRASDFKSCPLLYRFRSIDRLPEPPSPAATRGTLVHAVLERMFDLPASDRNVASTVELIEPEWRALLTERPELAELFNVADQPTTDGMEPDPSDAAGSATSTNTEAAWLASTKELVTRYFDLEDPTRLEPAAREELVETMLDDQVRLRGIIDRLDISPAGDIRVVDYKTGAVPGEKFETAAMFQLKFYALMVWRVRGVIPRQLRLIYLSGKQILDYSPDADELNRFAGALGSLATAIDKARSSGDFRPKTGPLCKWCHHQALCPAYGGTPPPFPD